MVDLVLVHWLQIQLRNVPYGLRLPFDFSMSELRRHDS